jgi:protein O-GlcNAc transferase
VHADNVHVLVDLDGYTAGSRLDLFAMRPAPVQLAMLNNYPGPLCAEFMQYTLLDADSAAAPASPIRFLPSTCAK